MTTRSSSALVAVSRRLISQHGQHQHGQFTTLAARAGCSSPSTSTLLHQRPPTTIARFHAPPWPSCCCGNRNPLTGPRTPFSPRYASTKKGKPTTNKEDKPTSKKNNKKGEDQDAAVADNDVRGGSREKKGKQAREVEAVEEFDYESFVEDGAKKHIERFVKDLAGLRTGSASPGVFTPCLVRFIAHFLSDTVPSTTALLEHILVKHKSSSLPLSQLAQITVKDQQTLIVLVNDDSVRISFFLSLLFFLSSHFLTPPSLPPFPQSSSSHPSKNPSATTQPTPSPRSSSPTPPASHPVPSKSPSPAPQTRQDK